MSILDDEKQESLVDNSVTSDVRSLLGGLKMGSTLREDSESTDQSHDEQPTIPEVSDRNGQQRMVLKPKSRDNLAANPRRRILRNRSTDNVLTRSPEVKRSETTSTTTSMTSSPSVPVPTEVLTTQHTANIPTIQAFQAANHAPQALPRANTTPLPQLQPIYIQPPPAQPQVLSAPQVVSAKESYSNFTRCLDHCWNFIYIFTICGFLGLFLYVYRLPEFNEGHRLKNDYMALVVEKTKLETQERMKIKEFERDLQLGIEKMRLAQEHEKTMAEQKSAEKLTEKFIDSNMEEMTSSSGFWDKKRVVQRRTYIERENLAGFTKLIRGQAGFTEIAGQLISDSLLNSEGET